MKSVFYILLMCFFVLVNGCILQKDNIIKETLPNENTIEYINNKNSGIITINSPIIIPSEVGNNEVRNIDRIYPNHPVYNISQFNINTTLDTVIVNPNFGIIAYNIPSDFKINQWSTIKLRISREQDIESIVLGVRNIPIVGIDSKDEVIIDSIEIDEYISARLYSDNNIEVILISNENQRLLETGYTEWVWRVKPMTNDRCYIKLTITLSERDLVVYEEEIPVISSWYWSFFNWLTKWWQAITATIITPILIPFIIWLVRRKKN